MAQKTISGKHLPKHCVRAPKHFVPHRIKLQPERKALAAKEAHDKEVMDDCADWQEYLEAEDALLADD